MVGTIVLSDVSSTADNVTAYTVAAGETIFVGGKATVAVSGSNSVPIRFTSYGSATIAGVVYSGRSDAILAADNLILEVTGQILAEESAVKMSKSGTVHVAQAAVVASSNYVGLYGFSNNSYYVLLNDGEISGYYGVAYNGTISITNTGRISASAYAVTLTSPDERVANSGFIGGVNGALALGSGGLTLINSGDVESVGLALATSSTTSTAANDYQNSGRISGGLFSVYTTDAVDRFVNTGTVIGAVSLAGGADVFDTVAGVVRGTVDMGAGDDTFLGSAFGDVVLGGAGSDTLKGYGGDDRLTGGAGGDVLSGGDGADTFIYLGVADAAPATPDLITDVETGVDKIDLSALGAGAAVAINLGLSNSTVYFQTAGAVGGQGVISLYGTIAANDIIVSAGTTFFVTGTQLADTIVGSSGVDYITGGGGADILTGGAGSDVFVYGSVADSPSGANDVILDFATGADKLDFTALGAGSAIAINMGPWSTVYYQTATSGSQGVIGVSGIVRGADLNVSAGATVYITGTAGSDVIYGSNVVDYISGGAGDDNIAGGLGADVLTGGAGSDAFYFFAVADSLVAAPDRITDFDPAADYIDFSGIDANTGAAGQQHFTLVAGFTASAGQLVSYVSGGFIHFDGDVNGDGVADFAVLVTPTGYWDPYADPSHLRL